MEIDLNKDILVDGKDLKVVIVLPYFNESMGLELLENTKAELIKNSVLSENIIVIRVSGALEIPFACMMAIKKHQPNAVIGLGVVVRGETSHYDLVTDICFSGMMEVQLKSGVPIGFGVLACEDEEQAKVRISKEGLNKGKQVAQAVLLQTEL